LYETSIFEFKLEREREIKEREIKEREIKEREI